MLKLHNVSLVPSSLCFWGKWYSNKLLCLFNLIVFFFFFFHWYGFRAFNHNGCSHQLFRYHETICWICSTRVSMSSTVLCRSLFCLPFISHWIVDFFFCVRYINKGPAVNSQWIYDTPVHSDVETKLRRLLVELGNDDKILGIQVHPTIQLYTW